jgi:hypothetical protein
MATGYTLSRAAMYPTPGLRADLWRNTMATRNRPNSLAVRLALDLIIAVCTLALLTVPLTGLTVHEWLGLAVAVPLVVHLLLNWSWIVMTTRRFLRRLPGMVRSNYVLNVLLFVTMTTVIFTGIAISEAALPALGLPTLHNPSMRTLHSLSADALLLVVGLHLALNWRWVLTALRRTFGGSPGRRPGRGAAVPAAPETAAQ